MLRNLSFCALFLMLYAVNGSAQTVTSDDHYKFGIFAGYSNNRVDINSGDVGGSEFFDDARYHNGVEVSGVGNFHRYFGVKGDFSTHSKKYTVSFPALPGGPNQNRRLKSTIYNFLGGIQIKDNAKEGTRFRPFGHALIGAARARNEDVDTGTAGASITSFTGAFGGGLDIRANRHLSIRAFQIDYNPTHFDNATQHNIRFGVGLVFH